MNHEDMEINYVGAPGDGETAISNEELAQAVMQALPEHPAAIEGSLIVVRLLYVTFQAMIEDEDVEAGDAVHVLFQLIGCIGSDLQDVIAPEIEVAAYDRLAARMSAYYTAQPDTVEPA